MTPEEHRKRHIELHQALDELLADWIDHVPAASIWGSVYSLMQWSSRQTRHPDEKQK